MKSFLTQTAQHYQRNNPSKLPKTVFIFPNHRSALHFRSELGKVQGTGNLARVKAVSINDFFQKVYGVETTDRIRLILALYACYTELVAQPEPLDEFIHWGRVMLSDFDNIDKYMVQADQIFVNVSDFRAMQDSFQYLTDTQRSAINHFLSHFRDHDGRLTVDMETDSEKVKSRFLKVWNLLSPLYKRFNEALTQAGMAYEGMIYRKCATAIKEGSDIASTLSEKFPGKERFVFVGLNALTECEKTLLRAMRDAGLAEFVWDFSSRELKDGRNKASFFLQKNVTEFPQAFTLDADEPLRRPKVRIVSVPSSVGQTKLAPAILAECADTEPSETAFVLPDENLLLPLLSAIPSSYENINITMGYPMDKTAVYSLLKAWFAMQLTLRIKDGQLYFHHKSVHSIFSNGVFRALLGDEDRAIVERVRKECKQYIPLQDLHGTAVMNTFFHPVQMGETTHGVNVLDPSRVLNPSLVSKEQNHTLENEMKRLLTIIETKLLAMIQGGTQSPIHADMELEFVHRYGAVLDSISGIDLNVLPGTYFRLLDGLLRSESVPFEGDALEGLQVMGTLETRALDFRNVVILNCNEDVFPHRTTDNSFIPPELRKGFGMPTIDYQDSVWAYYFYRLIQRAENVWMVYDSRTEGLLSGEESRYIKQLQYQHRYGLERFTAVAPVVADESQANIVKTQEDIDALRGERHLSASSLQSYLACPAKFYYQAVKGLRAEDDVMESMDAATLGTVFHSCMETLYKDKAIVTLDYLRRTLSDEQALRRLISDTICEKSKCIDVEGRNLVMLEVLVEYIKGAIRHDIGLLGQSGSAGFRIIGLERYLQTEIDGFKFIGFADRIDSYKPGEVRIVDYKTGHVEDDDILITDDNAQAVTDKLFGESNYGRPKIALQLWLYDQFAHREGIVRRGENVVNSIYSTAKLLTQPLPDVLESPEFSRMVEEKLHGVLTEIADTSIPWKRTTDKNTCAWCDFRNICGK